MKLTATRKTYQFKNESGYSFEVTAEEVPGEGWRAYVTMRTSGLHTADAAVSHLLHTAKAFVRQVLEGVE